MSNFRKYEHVEKLDKTEVEGILIGEVYVTAKVDGTNASLWYDIKEGRHRCGSRTREITPTKDNAGFAAWAIGSYDYEANRLRNMTALHPEWIIYGEWGLGKVGAIKTYINEAKDKMWIFDIYSRELERFLDYEELQAALTLFNLEEYQVGLLGILENPSQEEIEKLAEQNTFLMQEGCIGEGVVIKRYNYRNCYNRYAIGKYVRPAYTNSKQKEKKEIESGEIEKGFIDKYLTNEELEKAKAKVIVNCNVEEFDNSNKMIGMFMNLCWKDMVEENIIDAVKKNNFPVIDFKILNILCKEKCRQFLGL